MPQSNEPMFARRFETRPYMQASFRHTLRALLFLDADHASIDTRNEVWFRLFRAFLTIGTIIHYPNDKRLWDSLSSTEIWIDRSDLTVEMADRADEAYLPPDSSSTAMIQHAVFWWIAQFEQSETWKNGSQLREYLLLCPRLLGKESPIFNLGIVLKSEIEFDDLKTPIELSALPLFNSETALEKSEKIELAFGLHFGNKRIWHDWYQGFLDGKPLDWELQRRIALIRDEDWEKGPEHIAALIEGIREPFILRERIEVLEKLLPELGVSRYGIGGNSPPESIDEIDSPQKAATIVWAALDDLKTEIDSEDPKPGAIERAIAWLKAVILACAKWAGGHANNATRAGVNSAAVVVGSAAGIEISKIISSGEFPATISRIVESASKWLGSLL